MSVRLPTCAGLLLLFVLVLGGGVVGIASADGAADSSVDRSTTTALATDAGPIDASNVTAQSDTIQTEHFEINYEAGQRGDAESIASYADEYYELFIQRFGVAPTEGRVTVEVVAGDTVECDGGERTGCYKSVGSRLVLTSDDRQTFYHELAHRFQVNTVDYGPGSLTPEVLVEGTAHHITTPPGEIADSATFQRDDVYFNRKDAVGNDYDNLALFPEYVLHEYGSEGYDILWTENHPRELESVADEDYSTILDDFYAQLDEQEARMRDGGASAPGFTYDPFLVERGEEVTFDARTPEAIEALDRSWYNGEVEAYEWDFDGDGEIDATGPTATRTIDDPVDKTVALYVTIDGERHEATQTLLPAVSPEYSIQSVENGTGTFDYSGSDSPGDIAAVSGQNLTVDATVGNSGGIGGSETAELLFRGEVVDSTTVSVNSGETRSVTLSHGLPSDIETGNHRYQVRLDDASSREKPVYVVEEATAEVAPYGGMSVESSLVGGTSLETPVSTGSSTTVYVPVEITDPDGLSLPTEMELYLDGELVDQKLTTLSSNSDNVAFNVSVPDEPGEHELRAVIPDERGVFNGSLETTHTLVAQDKTRLDQPLPVRCGPELVYCSALIESVDAPETVEAGTEAEFDVELRWKEDHNDHERIQVSAGVDQQNEQIEGEMDNGSAWITVAETFDETGEYDITFYSTTVHTVTVAEDVETDPDGGENTGSTDDGSGSDADDGSESDSNEPTINDSTSSDTDGQPPESDDQSDSSTPGFGVAAAAFSVALSLLALRRSR